MVVVFKHLYVQCHTLREMLGTDFGQDFEMDILKGFGAVFGSHAQFIKETVEIHFAIEIGQLVHLFAFNRKFIELQCHGRIQIDRSQRFAHERIFFVIDEVFFHLAFFQFIDMLVKVFDGAVFSQELQSSLLADFGDARIIIRRIPHQPLHVDDLFRFDAVFFTDDVRCVGFQFRYAFDGYVDPDIIRRQLDHILIA
ncbi:hypothetical protein SDC9_56821 [bioreactor metagenome]|uniref:Uncharacterized protein n=1 Tax=bioreactor metagenome TaxID=1076179 RepID=A0A644X331_9ZZZZ